MDDIIFESQIRDYIEESYSANYTQSMGIKFIVVILYKILLEIRNR